MNFLYLLAHSEEVFSSSEILPSGRGIDVDCYDAKKEFRTLEVFQLF